MANNHIGKFKIADSYELECRIAKYFSDCDNHTSRQLVGTGANAVIMEVPDPQPYTWTGMAIACGLAGRQSLLNYRGEPEFQDTMEYARMRIQEQWEGKLQRLGNNSGVIYALGNSSTSDNTWSNKSEINIGGQADNPIQIKHDIDRLSEDRLRKIREILLEED